MFQVSVVIKLKLPSFVPLASFATTNKRYSKYCSLEPTANFIRNEACVVRTLERNFLFVHKKLVHILAS